MTPKQLHRTDIEGFDGLAELALDLRWAWNHASDGLWEKLDPEIWAQTHNPWGLLQVVSCDKLRQALTNPEFLAQLNELLRIKRASHNLPSWFGQTYPNTPLRGAAYFSMEFMLSESLPIYSGGLGNVAGDQLKGASDLGIPVVGIGLLYQRGYFRQLIDNTGAQQAIYPFNDPGQLPIMPLRQADGEWLRIKLDLPGHSIWLRAWEVLVGNARLLLLDSNDTANYPPYRGITGELYPTDPHLRLMQEIILGIGGWRLLMALGLAPEVCHLNEGHAAFAVLERANHYQRANRVSFEEALVVTRAGNLFTTHTAVAAGFDRYSPQLIEHCLGGYASETLGIPLAQLLGLGRIDPSNSDESFNMAYLAIRGSGSINGVSRLHGQVSRRLFAPLFPRWPEQEIPIKHVTNGVHMPSWDSAAADQLWTQACSKTRWMGTLDNLSTEIRAVPDAQIWQFRAQARRDFIAFVRARVRKQLTASGESHQIDAATHLFDPHVLTIGFARRFATYKRPNLLLQQPERLLRLLRNSERPVQLVLAGKAHPADQRGQALIQQWNQFIQRPDVRPHVVFLSDYDMLLAEKMVQGVDLWLNTPARPWEACGTSGMKVLVNGGLNLSELDGWWAEAYAPELGWALGDGAEHGEDPALDLQEANALYDLLETQVIPEFYQRDRDGIPARWVERIRASMATLTPEFSTNRSLRDYIHQHYIPAATAYHARIADPEFATRFMTWRALVQDKWDHLRFGSLVPTPTQNGFELEIQVFLDGLDPTYVAVQAYADNGDQAPEIHPLTRLRPLVGEGNGGVYGGTLVTSRPASDYTVRVVPVYPGVDIPLEVGLILWMR